MNLNNVWWELIVTIGAIATAMFASFRYFIQQSVKREKTMLEYFETKNGHMERMTDKFTNSFDQNTKALNKLTTRIAVISVSKLKRK